MLCVNRPLDRDRHGMQYWTRILKANFRRSDNEDVVPVNEKEILDSQRQTRLAQTRENVARAIYLAVT